MSISRDNENWMRYRVERRINHQHSAINSLLCRNKWLDRFDWLLQPERWYISIGITILTFVLVALIINGMDLAYIIKSKEDTHHPDFGKYIDDRASNLATIASMSMTVIGFLVTNLAIKELYALKLLFRRTKLSFVIIFALTSLAIFVSVSAYRYMKHPGHGYDNTILASGVMLIAVITLVGLLFVKIIYFVNPSDIDSYINAQLSNDAFILIREGLQNHYSKEAYLWVMNQAKVKPYNLSEAYTAETFRNVQRLIDNSNQPKKEEKKHYVADVNLGELRNYLKDREQQKLVYHSLYFGKELEVTDNYILVQGQENTKEERAILKNFLVVQPSYPSPLALKTIRKHHEEKMVSLAETNKPKELARVLLGIGDLYSKQFKYNLQAPFDLTKGLPALFEKALIVTIKEKNYNCFLPLFESVVDAIIKSMHYFNVGIYRSFLFLFDNVYLKIYPHRNDESYSEFLGYALKAASTYDAFLMELRLLKRQRPDEITQINQMGFLTFNQLCQLGHLSMNKGDLATVKNIAAVLDNDSFDRPDVEAQMAYYRSLQNPDENNQEALAKKTAYKQSAALRTYSRHSKLILQSWLIHLIKMGEVDVPNLPIMLASFDVDYDESRDALADLLEIHQGRWFHYFGLITWQLPKQDADDAGFTEDSIAWLTFGFFVGQIINNQMYFLQTESLRNTSLGALQTLISRLTRYKTELSTQFQKWQPVLHGVVDQADLEERANNFIRIFERLAENINLQNMREIADAILDKQVLQTFKTQSLSSWQQGAHIWQIFKELPGVLQPSSDQGLPFIGRNDYEAGLKQFFLHYDQHNDVNILRPIAGEAGRQSDTEFLRAIKQDNAPFREGDLTDLIIEALSQLRADGHSPDFMIVGSNTFSDDKLRNNDLYKQNKSDGLSGIKKMGEFDEVPIYYSYSYAAIDHIIIADTRSAFHIEYHSSEGLLDSFLDVSVEEVPLNEAKASAQSTAERRGTPEAAEKIEMSIRNGLRLRIGINAKLKVKEKNALRVGKILTQRFN